MLNKISLPGVIFIIICLMLMACGNLADNAGNSGADATKPFVSQQFNHKAEGVAGKAGIENIVVENGQISFRIKNLTTDNKLLSAYLEYVRLEDGKEMGRYPLDCDVLNLQPNTISEAIFFNSQKPLGKEGILRIKTLIFANEKDNYKAE